MKNIFEMASRMKFRFPYKGLITVEDLWDLSAYNLDQVYKTLNKDVKQSQEESLMNVSGEVDEELAAKIEIVKYIFGVKKAEAEKRVSDAEKAAKKQKILEILAKKQDDSLNNMSEEDLLKMLGEID